MSRGVGMGTTADAILFMALFLLFLVFYCLAGYLGWKNSAPPRWQELLSCFLMGACALACFLLMVLPAGTVVAANAFEFVAESVGAFFRWIVSCI